MNSQKLYVGLSILVMVLIASLAILFNNKQTILTEGFDPDEVYIPQYSSLRCSNDCGPSLGFTENVAGPDADSWFNLFPNANTKTYLCNYDQFGGEPLDGCTITIETPQAQFAGWTTYQHCDKTGVCSSKVAGGSASRLQFNVPYGGKAIIEIYAKAIISGKAEAFCMHLLDGDNLKYDVLPSKYGCTPSLYLKANAGSQIVDVPEGYDKILPIGSGQTVNHFIVKYSKGNSKNVVLTNNLPIYLNRNVVTGKVQICPVERRADNKGWFVNMEKGKCVDAKEYVCVPSETPGCIGGKKISLDQCDNFGFGKNNFIGYVNNAKEQRCEAYCVEGKVSYSACAKIEKIVVPVGPEPKTDACVGGYIQKENTQVCGTLCKFGLSNPTITTTEKCVQKESQLTTPLIIAVLALTALIFYLLLPGTKPTKRKKVPQFNGGI